jgi:hypothetical protein
MYYGNDGQLDMQINMLFSRHDYNGTGFLGTNELVGFLNELFAAMGYSSYRITYQQAQQILYQIDRNCDGRASRKEVKLMYKQVVNNSAMYGFSGQGKIAGIQEVMEEASIREDSEAASILEEVTTKVSTLASEIAVFHTHQVAHGMEVTIKIFNPKSIEFTPCTTTTEVANLSSTNSSTPIAISASPSDSNLPMISTQSSKSLAKPTRTSMAESAKWRCLCSSSVPSSTSTESSALILIPSYSHIYS